MGGQNVGTVTQVKNVGNSVSNGSSVTVPGPDTPSMAPLRELSLTPVMDPGGRMVRVGGTAPCMITIARLRAPWSCGGVPGPENPVLRRSSFFKGEDHDLQVGEERTRAT